MSLRPELLADATEIPAAGAAGGSAAPGLRLLELPPARGEREAARRVDLVLGLLTDVAAAVLVCIDDPGEDEVGGEWAPAGEGRWRLPDTPIDLGLLLDWLSTGTWQLVGFADADAVPVVPVIDLHEDPEGSAAELAGIGAAWAIDVFHDEHPWRLALG
ncbi:MAG: hypothetical protein H6742_21855 [Alphaproteobacteria bacterium]|nr:hypothetical protein [Alphaproteobacteria bacterium]